MAFLSFVLFSMNSPLIAKKDEKASGSLKIQVQTKGLLPPPPLQVSIDAKVCGPKRQPQSSLINAQGALENAVAWLEPPKNSNRAAFKAPQPPHLHIKNCEFAPRITLAEPGSILKISSEDPILFHIRSLSKTKNRFQRSLPPNLASIEIKLADPEILSVVDDLHPWMKAFVLIAPHELYRISNSNGVLEFDRIPKGEYRLHLWHEVLGDMAYEKNVTIGDQPQEMTILWEAHQQ